MKCAAVIFDLDGTVLDNELQYNKAFNTVLRSLGVDVSKPIAHTHGIGLKANWQNLIEKLNIQTDQSIETLSNQTQVEYQKYLNQVRVREGFTVLAAELRRRDVKLALATSNTLDMTERILNKLAIKRFFDIIVSSDEVTHTKPHPELFLLAATKLNIDPNLCVVIEDAESGIQAAKKAGMRAILISDKITSSLADMKVHFFHELNYPNICALI